MYPAKQLSKKPKKDVGEGHNKFSIETTYYKSLQIACKDGDELLTLFMGLQSVACKPGEQIVTKGGFLWMRTRAKLFVRATQQGLSPMTVLAQACENAIPADAKVTDVGGAIDEPLEEGEEEASSSFRNKIDDLSLF